MPEQQIKARWTDQLGDDDLAFVKRFVLASGSLKELARVYGVSYPTIRLRVDRLIAKVRLLESQEWLDDLERLARMMHVSGKLDAEGLRALLAAHRKVVESNDESDQDDRSA